MTVFARIPHRDEHIRSEEEEEEEPIQFQAKQTVSAADIKLRIDAPPSADNAVEVEEFYYKSLKKIGTIFFFKNEDAERGTFSSKLDFLFSCISVSVGLGNVWLVESFMKFF